MTSRRRQLQQQPTEGGTEGNIFVNFKNRESVLEVRDISEVSASQFYNICRVKANQVMMMKHRGYVIEQEERVWLECAVSERALINRVKELRTTSLPQLIASFRKTYELVRKDIKSQTAYTYYPYLDAEGSEELKVGEFQYSAGKWELIKTEEELIEPVVYETEVVFLDSKPIMEDYIQYTFSEVPRKIIIDVTKEESFKKDTLPRLSEYRKCGIEIFHMTELYIDYFQHWLVPKQQIVNRVDKLRLLNSHLMIKKSTGEYEKVPNCKFEEMGLPTVYYTDIVVRYMGALPGDIIFWENESYISSFVNNEFGYMMVVGHMYSSNRTEEQTFSGERIPEVRAEEEEEPEEPEMEDEMEDEDDDFGGEDDED